jgi:hypothetical protein
MRARTEEGDGKGSVICLGDLGRRTVVCEGLSVVVDRLTRSAIASADMNTTESTRISARPPSTNPHPGTGGENTNAVPSD